MDKKRRRKTHRSIDARVLPLLLKKFRREEEKSTLHQVHQAFIYGVNLSKVPLLKEKYNDMKKHIKEDKVKKKLRKTMHYFRKIDKANKSIFVPIT